MNVDRLTRLQKAIPKRGERTAEEIAEELKWSLPSVYRGMKQLEGLGAVVARVPMPRSGVTGPIPKGFVLVKEAAL